MPRRLTAEQVERYHCDGFCAPVEVMSAGEAAQYRLRLEAAEQHYPAALGPTARNNPHLAFTVLDEIVHHPAILDAVEDLIGPDILCWGTVLFVKEPGSKGYVSWHQDLTYVPLQPPDGVTAWLALSPATLESGCMRMLPASHLDGIRPHHDTFGADNILTRGQNIEGVDTQAAVDVPLAPGQISLHHGHTVHASPPNRGADRRVGVAIQQYLPPHVHERDGGGYAQLVRGHDTGGNFRHLERVREDMTRDAALRRDEVNDHFANFLYAGASQRRAY